MKRSEMIVLLSKSCFKHMNEDYTNDEEMYSAIISDIEAAGMLPPYSELSAQHRLEGHIIHCVWDPEDVE